MWGGKHCSRITSPEEKGEGKRREPNARVEGFAGRDGKV